MRIVLDANGPMSAMRNSNDIVTNQPYSNSYPGPVFGVEGGDTLRFKPQEPSKLNGIVSKTLHYPNINCMKNPSSQETWINL